MGSRAACGQHARAELADGAGYVLEAVGFEARLRRAAAVVTGEGRLDVTTLAGKVVSEVARRARAASVRVRAVVGRDASTPAERGALGLASIREASTVEEIGRAAGTLASELATG